MRLSSWSHNLEDFIDSLRDKPFSWGKNDCLTFANGSHIAMTGNALASDWVGGYSSAFGAKKRYLTLLKKQGSKSIIEAIDKRLQRLNTTLPPRGSIAARKADNPVTGVSLGVCVGEKIAYVGDDGLVFMPPQNDDVYWAV